MGRTVPLFVLAAALGVAGCGGSNGPAKPSVACDDASFRAQDEELYVTRSSITNALARSGDPATLVLDLRRARKVLSEYLAAHPPCDARLRSVAEHEQNAVDALGDAIEALDGSSDPTASLKRASEALQAAQSGLSSAG